MNKKLCKLMIAATIMGQSLTTFAATPIYLNGERLKLEQQAFIENGRTYLPLKAVSKNLGATVSWDSKTKAITITKDYKTIVLHIGNDTARVNNKIVKLSAAPLAKDGTTYVPVKFVADCLGVPLDYYSNSGIVSLITDTENAAQIKEEVSQIKEVITPITDLSSTPVSQFGKAFIGSGAKKLHGGAITEVRVITKGDLPIQVGDLTLYDIYFNSDNTISVKGKMPYNESPNLWLSDSLGLIRYRNKSKSTTDTKGFTTTIYSQTGNTDWELDGIAYRKYTLDKVNYFVFKEKDTLVAISRTEVLK